MDFVTRRSVGRPPFALERGVLRVEDACDDEDRASNQNRVMESARAQDERWHPSNAPAATRRGLGGRHVLDEHRARARVVHDRDSREESLAHRSDVVRVRIAGHGVDNPHGGVGIRDQPSSHIDRCVEVPCLSASSAVMCAR